MKKIICLILSICMLIPCIPAMAAGELSWTMPSGYYTSETYDFFPLDNYYSHQNSPSFCWPIIYDATYEIVLANDKELTDIAYKEENLQYNVFTFEYTLEANKQYYWAVRYKLNNNYSAWSEPRRIFIDPKAAIFTAPKIGELSQLLKNKPVFMTQEKLDAIKKIDKTEPEYLNFKKTVDAYVNIKEFESGEIVSTAVDGNPDENDILRPSRKIYAATIFYYITGEKKYLDYAIEAIEYIKDLNPPEMFVWAPYADTAEQNFSIALGISYDMLYPYMNDNQRKIAVTLIERAIQRPWIGHAKGGDFRESLYAAPITSHPWGLFKTTIAALSIYNESELARKVVEFNLPLFCFTRNYAANSLEDGTSAWGMFYGSPSFTAEEMLSNAKIAELSGKPTNLNTVLRYLYLLPPNWTSSTGDSYNTTLKNTYQHKLALLWLSANCPIPEYAEYAKWLLKQGNNGSTQYYYPSDPGEIFSNANTGVKITAPYILPTGKQFKDTGVAGIHSDLKDPERVGLTFRSSWFGSANHAHPDQNSFVIEAYGEDILNEVDYYTVMGDSFDTAFNTQTFAHNAITYNNGIGQPNLKLTARGMITDFVNQRDYSLVSGDATEAYYPAFSKAQRDIIYIAPETYIIIDDLAAKSDPLTYEFILNSKGDFGFYKGENSAKITQGKAVAEVKCHYPKNVTSNYIDIFAGPDLNEAPMRDDVVGKPDKRLYFQTEKTDATKMITTIAMHKNNERARNIREENFKDYMKLYFEDGSICYINLSGKERIKTNDGIEFSGRAFIFNETSSMLIGGTYASIDSKEIISSDAPISAAIGKEEISISSMTQDSNVKIAVSEKPSKLIKQDDIKYIDITENEQNAGVLWNYEDGYINAKLYQSQYILYTDKKELPGKTGTGVIKVTIDGETKEVPFESQYDINGNLTYDWWMEGIDGMYLVESMNDVTSDTLQEGQIAEINNKKFIYVNGDNPELKLKNLSGNEFEVIANDDEKAIEPLLDAKVRATQFVEGGKGGKPIYWERINNDTLQSFVDPMQSITYELEVPEDGKYDFVMSLSTVSMMTSKKSLFIGGEIGSFVVPATDLYSNLQSVRIKCGAELKKGTNRISFMNMDEGRCIFDWIGLIKSDK